MSESQNETEFCAVCERSPAKCICDSPLQGLAEEPGNEHKDMMGRYNSMIDGEAEAAAGDEMPTLAVQREQEARDRAMQVFNAARKLAATGMIQPAGYRVLVKPLEGILELEDAQRELAPTLAAAGFQQKSDAEKKREERGENYGVLIDIGPVAFERMGGQGSWCDIGDVVVFSRYAGTRVEHPRGSGVFYQLMNDEDLFGKIV